MYKAFSLELRTMKGKFRLFGFVLSIKRPLPEYMGKVYRTEIGFMRPERIHEGWASKLIGYSKTFGLGSKDVSKND